MLKLLSAIHDRLYYQSWPKDLVDMETTKAYASLEAVTASLTSIIKDASCTPEDRAWARDRFDKLFIAEDA